MFETEFKSGHQTTTQASAMQGGQAPFFQAKLTVNSPGDAHEREADQVADRVMRMQDDEEPVAQRMPLAPVSDVQRKCNECEEKEQEKLQRSESGNSKSSGHTAPPIVGKVLSSGSGKPMDAGTRQFMESRFGQDFGQVRIHTDSRAAESAAAIQAKAYTSGSDIVFGVGQYRPESGEGRRLLAHELAHVGQHGGLMLFRKVSFTENKPQKTVNPATNIKNGIPNMGKTSLKVNGMTSWKNNPFAPPAFSFDAKSGTCTINEPTNTISYEVNVPIDKEWVETVDKSWLTSRNPKLKEAFEARKCTGGQVRIIVQSQDKAKIIQEIIDHEKKHADDMRDIYSGIIEPWDKEMAARVAKYTSAALDQPKCSEKQKAEQGSVNALYTIVEKEVKTREETYHKSKEGSTKIPAFKKIDCDNLIYTV